MQEEDLRLASPRRQGFAAEPARRRGPLGVGVGGRPDDPAAPLPKPDLQRYPLGADPEGVGGVLDVGAAEDPTPVVLEGRADREA
jgi:hypothetical protein